MGLRPELRIQTSTGGAKRMGCDRKCVNGVHTYTGEELGYTRVHDLDTAEYIVYMTPSHKGEPGVPLFQPRRQKLVFAQICNCEREKRGLPLLPEKKFERAA
jgi:hypothetical protein